MPTKVVVRNPPLGYHFWTGQNFHLLSLGAKIFSGKKLKLPTTGALRTCFLSNFQFPKFFRPVRHTSNHSPVLLQSSPWMICRPYTSGFPVFPLFKNCNPDSVHISNPPVCTYLQAHASPSYFSGNPEFQQTTGGMPAPIQCF